MPQEAPINYTFPEKQQRFLLAKDKRDVKVKQERKGLFLFLTVAGFADTGDSESRTVGSVLRLRSLVACIDRLSLSRSQICHDDKSRVLQEMVLVTVAPASSFGGGFLS